MSNILKKRVVFTTLFILTLTVNLFSIGFTYVGDKGILLDKAEKKIKKIGDELYEKTKVSTVLIVKNHLDKKEFLQLKDKFLKQTQKPYIIWIFSKSYEDRKDIGLNQMFNSPELDSKFDKDSLFSPFTGTFTKILTVHKSKVDPTSAAFLNGFSDLADMVADSYGVKLKESIGDESHISLNVIRVIFYGMIIFVLLKFLYMKIKYKGK